MTDLAFLLQSFVALPMSLLSGWIIFVTLIVPTLTTADPTTYPTTLHTPGKSFKLQRDKINNASDDFTCEIKESHGFLKNVCKHKKYTTRNPWYKCVNTNEYYRVEYSREILEGSPCSNDPHFYQVCGTELSWQVTNKELLCEFYLCESRDIIEGWLFSSMVLFIWNKCDLNCSNTDLNRVGCEEKKVALPSGKLVNPSEICNEVCEARNCEDEAQCNGHIYGLYCMAYGRLTYMFSRYICDRWTHCDNGEDEANCTVTDTQWSCRHVVGGRLAVPLHNFTRCAFMGDSVARFLYQYCKLEDLAMQQTNCSDPQRIGLSCEIKGYVSTVSKYLICYDDSISACDDGIDSNCLWTKSCSAHKHALCDNKKDCVDLADENHPDCRSKTKATCKRRVGNMDELPIPISWLRDGVRDCQNGADEINDWPTCGKEETKRFVSSDEVECENVFLCISGSYGYIELNNLCDGVETCGNENVICSVSSRSQSVTTSVLTENKGLAKRLSYCLDGLDNLQILLTACANDQFIFPDEDIFGVDTKTSLTLPNKKQSCDNMYGEMYLYTSCTGRCADAVCPLRTIPRYEVCPNQLPDRVGTLVNNEYLIFLTRSFGNIYTNNYFVCDDKIKCIEYSKVCDFVYNCLDESDEAHCSNHFKCNSSGKLLPKTKQCDGNFDCPDQSDECNEQCSKEILEGILLKGVSWLIGLLAVVANLVIIGRSLWTLKQCKTAAAVINRGLIIMIALGDFLIGCYLLIIVIYDTIIFKNHYCKRQISWITSLECSLIGVVSTIGSQISLFSMTGLSIVRIHGIWNSMRIPGEVTRAQIMKIATVLVSLVLTSAAVAIVPIMAQYEDFFVNGVKFDDRMKIFIGTPGKSIIQQVIEAYYGRTKDATLKWDTLIEMVQAMFSHDLHYEDITEKVAKVDFYGNDGVCLFKYFVQDDDPQKLFVWSILSINFICFIFITISYLLIGILSRKSSKSLATSQNNQQIIQRNRRMNQRIAIIITTDFLCWVPFIVICTLHSLNIIDATAWYSIFSMIILPINSVINPLLYDDVVTSQIGGILRSLSTRASNSVLLRSLRQRFTPTQAESTELEYLRIFPPKWKQE